MKVPQESCDRCFRNKYPVRSVHKKLFGERRFSAITSVWCSACRKANPGQWRYAK